MGISRKGENWFIDYRARGRRIRGKIGPSKKLAESVLAKRKLELAENRFLDVRRVSRETFRGFAQKYFDWVRGRIRGPSASSLTSAASTGPSATCAFRTSTWPASRSSWR